MWAALWRAGGRDACGVSRASGGSTCADAVPASSYPVRRFHAELGGSPGASSRGRRVKRAVAPVRRG